MSDEPDPWSKNVPIAPAPTSFIFGDADTATPPRSVSGQASTAPPPGEHSTKNSRAARRRWVGIGAALSVIAVGVAIATLIRDDTESGTTADPAVELDSGLTIVDEIPTTSVAPTPLDTPIKINDGPTPLGAEAIADEDEPAAWIDGQFVLPERFRQIEPTSQLVVLTSRGRVIEIDIPSGSTSTLALDQLRYTGELHVRENATLVTSDGGSGATPPTLLVGNQPAVDVDLPSGSEGYFIYDTGSNVGGFAVQTYDSASGEETQLSIGDDGVATEVFESAESFFVGEYEVSTGERLRYDGGDVFLVTPPEQQPEQSRRISTGDLIGRSPTAIFVDECDAVRTCGYAVIDVKSGDRTAVADELWDRFSPNLQNASMSPDGTAMLVTSGRAGESYFVELLTGGFVQLPVSIGSDYGRAQFAWSPDSSGIFAIDDGVIVFIDRPGTKMTPLPIEFDDADTIVDIGIRIGPTT